MNKYWEYTIMFLIGSLALALVLICAGSLNHKKKCSDFYTWQDAQNYMNKHDAIWLDRDDDGMACEALAK